MGFVALLFPGGVLLILHFKCIWNGTFSSLQRAYGRGITEDGSHCPAWRETAADSQAQRREEGEEAHGSFGERPKCSRKRVLRLCLLLWGQEELVLACPFPGLTSLFTAWPSPPPNLVPLPLLLATSLHLTFAQTFPCVYVSAWKHSLFLSLLMSKSDSYWSVISSLETFLTNPRTPTSTLIPKTEISTHGIFLLSPL